MSAAKNLTAVLRALTTRSNEIVYVDELVEATGLTDKQIKGTLYAARANGSALANDVEVVIPATAWRYRGPASTRPEPPNATGVGVESPSSAVDVAVDDDDDDAPRTGDVDRRVYREVGRTGAGVPIVQELGVDQGPLYRLQEVQ